MSWIRACDRSAAESNSSHPSANLPPPEEPICDDTATDEVRNETGNNADCKEENMQGEPQGELATQEAFRAAVLEALADPVDIQ